VLGLRTRVRTRTTDTVAYRFVDVVPGAPLRPQRLSLSPQGHHLADELFADHPHFAGQIDLAPTPSPSEVPAPGLSDDIQGGLRPLGD
jgi:hypothetical protein